MKKKDNRGGARKGAGRPPKIAELKLIERLDNIINSDDAIRTLGKLMKAGDMQAVKLYFEYRFGKPRNNIDITSGDQVIQNFNLSALTEKELAVILKIHAGQSTYSDD